MSILPATEEGKPERILIVSVAIKEATKVTAGDGQPRVSSAALFWPMMSAGPD